MAPNRFADALASELAARGVTQGALADAVGVAQNTISQYTTGRFVPPPETVFAIEAALDVAPGALSQYLGYMPCDIEAPPVTVRAVVSGAPELEPWQRDALLAVYRTFVGRAAPARARRVG